MEYRLLGRTGLAISQFSLGTVALGVDYGIVAPQGYGRPPENEAIAILHRAADMGINFFDTAPAYGEGEALLGKALGGRPSCFFATKVAMPVNVGRGDVSGQALRDGLVGSIEKSLKGLRRDAIDVLQIHNATAELLEDGEVMDILQRVRQAGKVRFLGASVYGETAARAAIEAGVDMIQVAFNLLDQRMATPIFPLAAEKGVGVLTRSAFLKGALTPKAQWLPGELKALQKAVTKAKDALGVEWEDLPSCALRFCLAQPKISSALVGCRTEQEVLQIEKVLAAGPLQGERLLAAKRMGLNEERLLNPSHWPLND